MKMKQKYFCLLIVLILSVGCSNKDTTKDPTDVDKAEELLTAIYDADADTVKELLEEGQSPNVKNEHENTYLYLALQLESKEIVDLLIEYGANVDVNYNGDYHIIMLAVEKGYIELAKEWLKRDDYDVNLVDEYEQSLLLTSVRNQQIEFVSHLLDNDADPNYTERSDNWSPIHEAAFTGSKQLLDVLIENGATVDSKNDVGLTPLMIAALYNHTETINLLLKNNANIDLVNDYGQSALMIATENGNVEAVEALLEHNADKSITNDNGQTAIVIAEFYGYNEIKKMLQ